MPRKRKTKSTEPVITVKAMPPPVIPPIVGVPIRCIYESRLIVGGDKTPTGTRYEFETNKIHNVNEIDYQFLLEMETKPWGCCGGSVRPQKYFEAVEG
jgi:hypothetical protein